MSPSEIRPDIFSADAREFLALLQKHGVRYLIVGGHAAIFHGNVRVTGDTDIFYGRETENCFRLFAALQEFWGGDVPGVGGPQDLEPAGVITQFGRPPNRLDLINTIDGVSFQECWDQQEKAFFQSASGPVHLPVLNKSCLLKNKRASGRPKDLDDIAALGG